eukprot:TRINITY_DN61434_c0_g1_i1.p1 TRINITY_DN61434_c0_g1~~TRINITY_DN61434_c0_g1_i1.p1  ORF type:complete len:317 (+),score=97.25 TRINITY_DN61434_c0_g1_i1:67-951(+)
MPRPASVRRAGAALGSAESNEGAKLADRWQVFSSNPDKAWAEKVFLFYSPVWPVLFAAWSLSGAHLLVGDAGNLFVSCLTAAPNVVIPLIWCPTPGPLWEQYWFKFLLWVAIFTFVASYFFTEFFFDVLRMTYNFPHLQWSLDSALCGRSSQVVPLMMYPHGWYFFVTYHTCGVIFVRMVRSLVGPSFVPSAAAFGFAAWLFAWGEIWGTTMDAIKDQFNYADMDWALTWGAALYACYFIVSFPFVYGLDETPAQRWPLRRVAESALAASMLSFILLDLVTQFVIRRWADAVPH